MTGHEGQGSGAGEKRLFSVEQANSSLPLVKRIVHDITQAVRKVRDLQEQLESLQKEGDTGRADSAMGELSQSREEYQQFRKELSRLGCQLVDETSGTVEFASVVKDKQVILSWRVGESEINHWHDLGQDSHERRLLAELDG